MTNVQLRFIGLGLLFLFALFTGYLLSRGQRPFAPLLLLFHKASALGLTAVTVLTIRGLSKGVGSGTNLLLLGVAAGLLLVLLFATGGVLSASKTGSASLKAIHGLAPYAGPALVALGFLLLWGRR